MKQDSDRDVPNNRRQPRKVGINQFGEALAYAIPAKLDVWKCSACGRTMPLVSKDEPPIRCSNRKGGCGRLFHNRDVQAR